MVFARPGVDWDASGGVRETHRRIAVRIGHFGYDGWSLTVRDTFDSKRPSDAPEQFVFNGDELDTEALFSGDAAPAVVCRAIYKLVWSSRSGIEIASRRFMAYTDKNEVDGRMRPDVIQAQLDMPPELFPAELDMVTVTRDDVDFMREELEAHAMVQRINS